MGSAEQPWTKYLETASEDENTPLPSSFPDYLSFMNGLCKVLQGIFNTGFLCALGVRQEDQDH